MAENVSAMLTNWMMIVRTVVASMRANGAVVAAAVEAQLFASDPRNRVAEVLAAKADLLEHKLRVLRQRARAVTHERGDDDAVDVELAAAVAAVRDLVMRTRSLFSSQFSGAILAGLALTGETPDDPDALEEYAAAVRDALGRITLPATDDGVTIDSAHRARLLDEGVTRLHAAIEATAAEDREEQGVVGERNKAEADLRQTYIGIADGFAADAVLAGRPDIADRVRPTSRRRKGIPEEVDHESDVEGDAENDVGDDLVTGDPNAEE